VRADRDSVRRSIENRAGGLWWPGLAQMLARERQSRLSFHPAQYSTSRFLGADGPERVLTLDSNLAPDRLALRLEVIEASVARHFSDRGIDLIGGAEITAAIGQTIAAATSLICLLPSLATTVSALVRSVHVLRSTDPGIDISFSDPAIPFSIFLSVSEGAEADLRIAEAIIHESMHLQLSLVEELVPIVMDDRITLYSPWKQATRPLSGVIHALYVFRVIDKWLASISPSDPGSHFIDRRRAQIADEIKELDLAGCESGLTGEGRKLLSRLLCATDSSYQTC
jgi:HEXXH motif-containing protein